MTRPEDHVITTTQHTERRITCRYLRRNDERCTAEVADPEGDILLCTKHLTRAMYMIRARLAGR